MREQIDQRRRSLLGVAAVSASTLQFATLGAASPMDLRFIKAPLPEQKPRSAASMGPIRQVYAGDLNIGYAEAGSDRRPVVILLHGWPYDIHAFANVAPILAAAGYKVITPYLRGFGSTHFRSHEQRRNGQQAVLGVDVIALMNSLGIGQAILAGFDWGARTANVVAALWPERCKAMVSVSGYLINSREANTQPLLPEAELAWWYQYYFATERGKAGYAAHRRAFAKLIWRTASPTWQFDEAEFDRSADAFDNPDHVDIVVHNYRWRLGLADGDPKFDDLERRLAARPVISVPTITLEGDANGAPHPEPSAYAKMFSGKYMHRLIAEGVGHNLPQEAPQAFAQAVIEIGSY